MVDRLIDTNLDFQRAGTLKGAKFELKTRAELNALEVELLGLADPTVANGLTVTVFENAQTSVYSFHNAKGFITPGNFRNDVPPVQNGANIDAQNFRFGEKFSLTGATGEFVLTSATATVSILPQDLVHTSKLANAGVIYIIDVTNRVVDATGAVTLVEFTASPIGSTYGSPTATLAELATLETSFAAEVDPSLRDGFSVKVFDAANILFPSEYTYSSAQQKFITDGTINVKIQLTSLTQDIGGEDIRVGEEFYYQGPAGTLALVDGANPVFYYGGKTVLGPDGEGSLREKLRLVTKGPTATILEVVPLSRNAGGGGNANTTSFFTTVDLVSGPNTITHNLALIDKDAFTTRVADSAGNELTVDIDSVNVNSFTISTLIPKTGVKVAVVGQTSV